MTLQLLKMWRNPVISGTAMAIALSAVGVALYQGVLGYSESNKPPTLAHAVGGNAEALAKENVETGTSQSDLGATAQHAPQVDTVVSESSLLVTGPGVTNAAVAHGAATVATAAITNPLSMQVAKQTPAVTTPVPANLEHDRPLTTTQLSAEQKRAYLDRAWTAFGRNALTTPGGDNAVLWATKVLRASPSDGAAIEVLQAVVDQYLRWSNNNLRQRDLRDATRYLEKARALNVHATPDQIAAIEVLDTEIAIFERQVAKANRKRQRQYRRTGRHFEGPQWLHDIDSWLRTLPLPRGG